MIKPLYGHSSIDSAFLVSDYPYGGKRCRIRYWLEKDHKKGFRFCSQTENPKTLSWNNPKKSTYVLLAGCMYLDEKEHVTWSGLTEYSEASKVKEYLTKFPNADLSNLLSWCMQKYVYCKARAEGKIKWTINNVVKEDSEEENKRLHLEMEVWKECIALLK